MKTKNAVIAVVLTAAISTGAVYSAYHFVGSAANKSVDVVPVSSVMQQDDYSWYGFGDESTFSGNIIAMSAQNVKLNEEYTVQKVYVQAGDSVKKGDPLFEYDMTMTDLEREMKDLQKQMLEINLKSAEKTLEKVKNGQNPYDTTGTDLMEGTGTISVSDDLGDVRTMTADLMLEDAPEEDVLDGAADSETGAGSTGDTDGDASGEETGGLFEEEPSGGEGGDISDGDIIEENGQLFEEDVPGGIADSDLEIDDNHQTHQEGSTEIVIEDHEETEKPVSEETAIIDAIGSFASRAKILSGESRSEIGAEEVIRALKDWSLLSKPVEVTGTAADGSETTLTGYVLNDKVMQMLENGVIGQGTVDGLYQAYAIVAKSNFLYWLNTIVPEGSSLADVSAATLLESGSHVTEMLNAWERCEAFARQLQSAQNEAAGAVNTSNTMRITAGDHATGAYPILQYMKDMFSASELSSYVDMPADGDYYTLMHQIVTAYQSAEPETEPSTDWGGGDFPGGWDDGGFDSGLGGDSGMTAAEREQAIFEAQMQIKELNLQIREAEIELRKYDRTLDGKVVKAAMDGVVTESSAGDGVTMNDYYMVISGAKGMYLKGQINEFSLGTVKIGDQVKVSTWGGSEYMAEVVEISEYPSEASSMYYYGSGSGNPNASYYPFLAYIEDTEGLSEGDTNYSFVTNEESVSTGNITLDPYFVRLDAAGKSYVYIRGTDGLLKKQYVKLGDKSSSYSKQIVSGLRDDDLIAFPYGKNVREGAKTKQVETLSATDSTDYYG